MEYQPAFDTAGGYDSSTISNVTDRYGSHRVGSMVYLPMIPAGETSSTGWGEDRMNAIQKEFGSLDNHLWDFVGEAPLQTDRLSARDVPTKSTESITMSKDLKQRGMSFVGPTIMYAFMQSTGMVNDHYVSCFRFNAVKKL